MFGKTFADLGSGEKRVAFATWWKEEMYPQAKDEVLRLAVEMSRAFKADPSLSPYIECVRSNAQDMLEAWAGSLPTDYAARNGIWGILAGTCSENPPLDEIIPDGYFPGWIEVEMDPKPYEEVSMHAMRMIANGADKTTLALKLPISATCPVPRYQEAWNYHAIRRGFILTEDTWKAQMISKLMDMMSLSEFSEASTEEKAKVLTTFKESFSIAVAKQSSQVLNEFSEEVFRSFKTKTMTPSAAKRFATDVSDQKCFRSDGLYLGNLGKAARVRRTLF